jgi:carbamoyl-phosphate synthase large subunit
VRFLVTAAGAGPSISVIKAIKRHPLTSGAFVAATDVTRDSAGYHLADVGVEVPPASDAGFPDAVLQVAERHGVELVIPILDLEVPVLGAWKEQFSEQGIVIAVDPPETTARMLDKREAARLCDIAGIRHPGSWLDLADAPDDEYPLIGKPVRGTGSRGAVVIEEPGQPVLGSADMIWQRFVTGPEYSIDLLGDPASDQFVAVPRWRRRIKDGQMVFGETVADPDLLEYARSTAAAFGTKQMGCLQVIRDGENNLYFIEFNPRYGTGVSLSIEAGVHFPFLQWLTAFEPDRMSALDSSFEDGLRMIRHWEEIYYR